MQDVHPAHRAHPFFILYPVCIDKYEYYECFRIYYG